ncbi:MAG: hypothetical protein ABWX94_02685 [Candidatus Saccharimonadales bacterium]
MSEAKEIKRRDKKMTMLFAFCVVLLVGVVALAVLFFTQNGKNESTDNKAKSEQIIKQVSKLYVLPTEDSPTVAEIKDKNNLPKDQEFYVGAENGDFVLVYSKSKIALLYRESIHKLIRVSPVAPATESTDPLRSGADTR